MAISRVLTKEESDFDSRYLTVFIGAMQDLTASYYYPHGSNIKTKLSVAKKIEMDANLNELARAVMKRYLQITGHVFDYSIKREWVL